VRRTPGLRREKVAALAGMSIDYYTRLERGRETRPSPAVVDALARALKLDHDEHEHLRALAGTEPDAPDLAGLAGELLLKSPDFAGLWEPYDVTTRTAAHNKTFVGRVELCVKSPPRRTAGPGSYAGHG